MYPVLLELEAATADFGPGSPPVPTYYFIRLSSCIITEVALFSEGNIQLS
jgi:hypothetical protein